METKSVRQLMEQTNVLFQESRLKPFPYMGIRKLLRQYPDMYETLVSDLDWFDSNVAGYASRAETTQDWKPFEAEQAISLLARSFFEKHPEYTPLQTILGEKSDFDDLSYDIEVHEKMRQLLLLLLEFCLQ